MADGGQAYSTGRRFVHWWTLATAAVTFVLLCSGGLVTSHNAGLAVPDWPNSFGYNMFALPFSHWVGGVLLEHSHRLIGTLIGAMTAVLAIWLWVLDSHPGKRWPGVAAVVAVVGLLGVRQMPVYLTLAALVPVVVVAGILRYRHDGGRLRWLGMIALAAVVLQGVLGGIRVEWRTDEIGIFHGMVAQTFFAYVCVLAVMTGRQFQEKTWADYEPTPSLRRWALGATALIFLQLGLGATMRHEHIGLAVPDFPLAYGRILPDTSAENLAQINARRMAGHEMAINATHVWVHMAHRFVAVLIVVAVATVAVKARAAARRTRAWAMGWAGLLVVQVGLGAWTIWSNKAADVATTHMAVGALSLVVGVLLSFRLILGARTSNFRVPETFAPLHQRFA